MFYRNFINNHVNHLSVINVSVKRVAGFSLRWSSAAGFSVQWTESFWGWVHSELVKHVNMRWRWDFYKPVASNHFASVLLTVGGSQVGLYSLVFLAGALPGDGPGGEFPPLSPPDEPLSSPEVDGPAVTLKSQFSFEMRNSSWTQKPQHDVQTRLVLLLNNSSDYFHFWKKSGGSTAVKCQTTARALRTLSWCRLVAVFQSLSSRTLVMRGKRMEMPSAVCISDLENSAPVISHTGAFYRRSDKCANTLHTVTCFNGERSDY